MEHEFVNGIQDADVFLNQHKQSIERGSKILLTLSRAICPENGIHTLAVTSSNRGLTIKAKEFPNESFVIRTNFDGVSFIRRNDLLHNESNVFSSDFARENIYNFMKKAGQYLRLIDAGFEPVEVPSAL